MPLFPVLDLEGLVQETDKTRLDASKSYASGDIPSITQIEIKPSSGEAFYDVTETGYLDWQYDFDATPIAPATTAPETNTQAVTVRLTYQGPTVDPDPAPAPIVKTYTKNITVISAAADMLFSSDDQLRKHEGDIMKYVADGRATFKDVHRRAQSLILAWLDKESYVDDIGNKLTVKRLANISELADWATMMTLRLIFESISKAPDDVYAEKADKYEGLEDFYRGRAIIHIKPVGFDDTNADPEALAITQERLDIRTCRVYRR